jgi:hypothetical protein
MLTTLSYITTYSERYDICTLKLGKTQKFSSKANGEALQKDTHR